MHGRGSVAHADGGLLSVESCGQFTKDGPGELSPIITSGKLSARIPMPTALSPIAVSSNAQIPPPSLRFPPPISLRHQSPSSAESTLLHPRCTPNNIYLFFLESLSHRKISAICEAATPPTPSVNGRTTNLIRTCRVCANRRNSASNGIPLQGLRGRPRCRPDCILGDRAYDAEKIRRALRARHISPLLARRNTENGSVARVEPDSFLGLGSESLAPETPLLQFPSAGIDKSNLLENPNHVGSFLLGLGWSAPPSLRA
jgi:hypothetical protein